MAGRYICVVLYVNKTFKIAHKLFACPFQERFMDN